MKFKKDTIKSGMVIHCPKEEDAKALLEHLVNIGRLDSTDKAEFRYWYPYYKIKTATGVESSYIRFGSDEITEFSDLIESETLSGKEVIEWFDKYSREIESMPELFPNCKTITDVVERYTPECIMEKIVWYEKHKKIKSENSTETSTGGEKLTNSSMTKEPKPVEVEWETQYTIKSLHPDLKNWEDRVTVIGFENAREMRENSEQILKVYINSVIGGIKYPASDYYVIPLRCCRIKEELHFTQDK